MSVLIKMDMPERCGKCRFTTAFDCVVDGKFIVDHSKRRADCPLSEVPAHGRLIDADALKQNTYEIYDPLGIIEAVPVDDIDNAPTVIEAEE